MALTGKKRLFAEALLAGKSNKQAALDAGYSPASASAAGSRLAKDKDVLAHLARKKIKQEKLAQAPAQPNADQSPSSGAEGSKFDISLAVSHQNPRAFLMAAMNDLVLEPKLRIDAAKALMPFEFAKKGEGGKKGQQVDAAKKVASKFSQGASPKLVASGGKSV